MRLQRHRPALEPSAELAPAATSWLRRSVSLLNSSPLVAWTRRCIGTLLIFSGWSALQDAAHYGSVGDIFPAVCLWLFATFLLLPDTLPLICRFFNKPLLSIYLSSNSTPPLDYSLARRMVHRCEYSVATREYLKILEYYPKEFDAYRELIAVGLACDDPEFSKQIFDRAMSRLSTRQREALRAEFQRLAN